MRTLLRLVFLGTVLAFACSTALAQPPFGGPFGGRGNPAMLLRQESVQKELKVTDDQLKKIEDLSEQMREKFQEAFGLEGEERNKKMQELRQENDKALAGILKPDQLKRLKQISYQQQGAMAVADPEVAKALQLSDAQKEVIRKANQEMGAQMRELFTPGSPPDEEARKKMTELRTATADKIMKSLTSEQKAKLKELQGPPFKGEIRFGPPRDR
jgi:Spy/CpxP family protein refolding chaperone